MKSVGIVRATWIASVAFASIALVAGLALHQPAVREGKTGGKPAPRTGLGLWFSDSLYFVGCGHIGSFLYSLRVWRRGNSGSDSVSPAES